jgi:hypothetical protein
VKPIVLLSPPFLKCAGSHNDRAPLELAYVSSFLEDAGLEHVVLNADYLGSAVHVPWRTLFEHEASFCAAVDGQHPALDQCIELVMQFRPQTVVLSAGDSTIPTKDFGSPYIAAQVSKRLREYGVRTIGLGPMFVKDAAPFVEHFDYVFRSVANRSLVDVIVGELPDVTSGTPLGTAPSFAHTVPAHASDYVLTSFGCAWTCSFCLAPLMTGGGVLFQRADQVVQELLARANLLQRKRLYLADMIFPLNPRRLRLLADALDWAQLQLTCESRTDTLRPETLGLLRRIGVHTVKVGIESTDDETLARMAKRQTLAKEHAALELLREHGMTVTGYLILGDFYPSVAAMEATLERAQALQEERLVQDWVVNVAAYQTLGWGEERYDAHFSLRAARRQGIPEALVWRFLDLQEQRQHPTLSVLPA